MTFCRRRGTSTRTATRSSTAGHNTLSSRRPPPPMSTITARRSWSPSLLVFETRMAITTGRLTWARK
jgi:hypothetical protein